MFHKKIIRIPSDHNSMDETAYLLRSPANAQRLYESLEEFKQGKAILVDINDLKI